MPPQPWAAGNAAFRAGRLAEALAEYTACLESGGASGADRGTVLANRAQVHLQLRQPALALQDAEAALAADPEQAKAHFRKVTALAQLGRHAEAAAAAAAAQRSSLSAADKQSIAAAVQQASGQGGSEQPVTLAANGGSTARRTPERSWLPSEMRERSVFVPSADGRTENVLLMLHGLGDSPANYSKLAKQMALPRTLCLALAAPLRLPSELGVDDGAMWYQPGFMSLDEQQGQAAEREGWASALRLLCGLLRTLHERGGWPFARLHLFGFSQGGSVALGTALRFRGEKRLGGCISVSGSLPAHAQPGPDSAASRAGGTPVLITHGDRDDQVSREDVSSSVAALKAQGCPVRLRRVSGKAHAMVGSEGEMRALMEFWAETLKAAPPTAAAGEQYVEVQQ